MIRRLLAALAVLIFALTGPAAAQSSAPAPPDPVRVEVREPGLVANLHIPIGAQAPSPAILVLGGSEGGIASADGLARRLAREGYVAMAVAYFNHEGLPPALTDIPLETFDRALDRLLARPDVDPSRIGVMGASKGAEAALLVASRRPEIRAVVAGTPTNVAWQGIDFSDWTKVRASWSVGGKPVAFVPYATDKPFAGLRDLYDRSLPAEGKEGEALIRVERINGDVLLISGGEDGLWGATPMSERIERRLKAHRFRHRVEHLSYPGAGHAILGPPPASVEKAAPLAQLGGTAQANLDARADAWPRTLAFLAAALKEKKRGH